MNPLVRRPDFVIFVGEPLKLIRQTRVELTRHAGERPQGVLVWQDALSTFHFRSHLLQRPTTAERRKTFRVFGLKS